MAARGARRLCSRFVNKRGFRILFAPNSSTSTVCWDLKAEVSNSASLFLSCRHWSSGSTQGVTYVPLTRSVCYSYQGSLSGFSPIVSDRSLLKNVITQRKFLEENSNGQPSGPIYGNFRSLSSVTSYSDVKSENVFRLEYCDEMARASNAVPTHKALLVDAAGTLLVPSQPAAKVYKLIGEKYGVTYSEQEILARYRWAYSQPWCRSRLRFVKDARPFWQYIVEQASGCSDSRYFEELYQYYATAEAWQISDPEAGKVFKAIRAAGIKLAVVSNFDTRLRPLLHALNCDQWFHALAVSAEVEAEKPNPTIFLRACELLGVDPVEAVHVGDDRRNDIWGARDAGCDAWLWGADVFSFREVAERIGVYVP